MQWSGAAPELRELVKGLGIPMTETLMALGSYPASDSLRLGMLGMHGSYGTNTAVCNTDCLIAVGARFDDRVTGKISEFAPKAETIIHIDIDPSSISKNVKVDIPIVGDIKSVLTDMLTTIKGRESIAKRRADWAKWHQQILQWKKEKPLYENDHRGESVSPHDVIAELNNITKGDCDPRDRRRTASDVGGADVSVRESALVADLGRPGHDGLWAAGRNRRDVCRTRRKVVVISGDGSIQMNIQELGTAVQYNVDIKVIILNNYFLGMVRQWQETLLPRALFVLRDVGAELRRCWPRRTARADSASRKPKDLVATMKEAFATPGPVLIDVVIPKEEAVMPMIPPGGAMSEMLFA